MAWCEVCESAWALGSDERHTGNCPLATTTKGETPDALGLLHGKAHKDIGRSRVAKTARTKEKP